MGKETFSVALLGDCGHFVRQLHMADLEGVRVYALSSLEHFGLEAGFDMLIMDLDYFTTLPASLLIEKAAAGHIRQDNLVVVRRDNILYGYAGSGISRRVMALLFKSLGHLPPEPSSPRVAPWVRFLHHPGVIACYGWCKHIPLQPAGGGLWPMAQALQVCLPELKATEIALKAMIATKKEAGVTISEAASTLLDTLSSLLMVSGLLSVPGIGFSVEEEEEYLQLIHAALRKLSYQLLLARFRYMPDETFEWFFEEHEQKDRARLRVASRFMDAG